MEKHPLANCDQCPLKGEVYVPSTIKDDSEVIVIGEAPGFHETAYKQPFRGPSGQLIRQVIKYHGITKVSYTNVCSCRPEHNATPSTAAVIACRNRLVDDVTKSSAKYIIALGGTATEVATAGSGKITKLRVGPPKQPSSIFSGSAVEKVVPTWHPAYCLRNADAFPTLVSDVGKLRQSATNKWQDPEWFLADTEEDALRVIASIDLATDKLVVDIETGIDKEVSFDHPNNYQLLCVGLSYGHNECYVIGEEALKFGTVITVLASLLRRKKCIYHNGKFDIAGLYPTLGVLKIWFDTMLASYCIDERAGVHGLKVRSVELLGAPQYDDEIAKYVPRGGNYANIPRPILYRYNAFDVACTWDLYELFEPLLESEGSWPYIDRPTKRLRDVHDFLVLLANELVYLELNGITIDREYNRELTHTCLDKLARMEEELSALVSRSTNGEIDCINPRSPKQIKEFFTTKQLLVDSTDEDTLIALIRKLPEQNDVAEFCKQLLLHRREQKRYGTYVKGFSSRLYRGRVYTTYMLHGTTSGRLASRNPNLQNVIRDKAIKRQFVVSKPNNVFIHCDYGQAEGRVIAYLAQDEYLRSVFSDSDADLFDELGSQLYNVPIERLHDGSSSAKEMRIRTKAFFYGLSYGRTAYTIAIEFNIPISEAEMLYNNFMNLIPDVVAWQNNVRETVLTNGILISPFGRRRRFPLITKQNKSDVLREALAFLPQSTASDICARALVRIRPQLKGIGHLRLTIHDALVSECPEVHADQVAQLMQREMIQSGLEFTDYVPFVVDTSIGKHWGEL